MVEVEAGVLQSSNKSENGKSQDRRKSWSKKSELWNGGRVRFSNHLGGGKKKHIFRVEFAAERGEMWEIRGSILVKFPLVLIQLRVALFKWISKSINAIFSRLRLTSLLSTRQERFR